MDPLTAWRALLQEFLDDMCHCWPAETSLRAARNGLRICSVSEVKAALDSFMQLMVTDGKYELVMERNADLWSGVFVKDLPYIGQLKWGEKWEGASEATKSAIWDYMDGLYSLGTKAVIGSSPDMSRLVDSITPLAQAFAERVKRGEASLCMQDIEDDIRRNIDSIVRHKPSD